MRIIHDLNWPLSSKDVYVIGLAGASLIVILWAGSIVWEQTSPLDDAMRSTARLSDYEPLAVGVVVWAIALIVGIGARRRVAATLFLMSAAALGAGKLSGLSSDAGGRLFYVLLCWIAPVTFEFQQTMLGHSVDRVGRSILRGLYGLAFLGSVPFLMWPVVALQLAGRFLELRLLVRLLVTLSFGLGSYFLIRDYRRAARPSQQSIRMTVFGTLFAVVPLILLSLLPDTLGSPLHLPYEWTFPWLVLAPLSYTYALYRGQLTASEFAVNRFATYYLAVTLFLFLYLGAFEIFNYFVVQASDYWLLSNVVLGVALLVLFAPLQRLFRRLTKWILYGKEIRYVEVVERLSEELALATKKDVLRQLLVIELSKVMRLGRVVAWIRETDYMLGFLGTNDDALVYAPALDLSSAKPLFSHLEHQHAPISTRQMHRFLSQVPAESIDCFAIRIPGIAYWLPLVSATTLQGLMLIGGRAADDPFSAEEERILSTLAHQGGIAAHNVRLTEQVRASRQELARAHEQLLLEQDMSQRRLALELHDHGIQQLSAILFQFNCIKRVLAGMPAEQHAGGTTDGPSTLLSTMEGEVRSLIFYLRTLTYELHPPGLEETGLSLALESYANQLAANSSLPPERIRLQLAPVGPSELPMPVATCLFRAVQEGLRNAIKHAGADRITLDLVRTANRIQITLQDDGKGFRVPTRLSELTNSGHFGLVGIAERMAWCGGSMELRSGPGKGTQMILVASLGAPSHDATE